jgi:hypothetical protein
MLNIRSLFKNHFSTARISDDNFRKFANDHVARITANNTNGQYTTILQATTQLSAAYDVLIKQEDSTYATQQSNTLKTDQITEQFKKAVSQREGTVRGEFGVGSPEYQDFFPNGVTEYSTATRGNIETLLQRITDKSQKYAPTLGNNLFNIFSALQTQYQQARNEQLVVIGNVDMIKSQVTAAREALEHQIMLNILTLATEFLGVPDRADDFFDQSIIRPRQSKDDGTIEESVSANAVQNIESKGVTDNSEITFENKGTTSLHLGRYDDNVSYDANIGVVVNPSQKITIKAIGLGSTGNNYINVKNLSATTDGDYAYLIT